MGIRSDVAIAIKNEAFEALSQASQNMLRKDFVLAEEHDEGMLYHSANIKWYVNCDPEIAQLYEDLHNLEDEESFLILEACHDYPEHRDNDLGEWYENPWNVFREVRVSIDWC